MRTIDISTLDANLLADLGDNLTGYVAYEADYAQATVSNQRYHIAFSPAHQRGGIVFVGSGSDGLTAWTDATSPEEVLTRFEAGEMIA